jgi:hypothetical protein
MTDKITITGHEFFSRLEKASREVAAEVKNVKLIPGYRFTFKPLSRLADSYGEFATGPSCALGHVYYRAFGTTPSVTSPHEVFLDPKVALRRQLRGRYQITGGLDEAAAIEMLFGDKPAKKVVEENDLNITNAGLDRQERISAALVALADWCQNVNKQVLPALEKSDG